MDKVIIKAVFKQISFEDNKINIHNKFGKDKSIDLEKVKSIDYTIASLAMNGIIKINYKNINGTELTEEIMYRCTQTELVKTTIKNLGREYGIGVNITNTKLNTDKDQKKANISKSENTVSCPKCGGTQLTANKKGFSLGKALVGGLVLVPIAGVATGMIGKNKIIITCLSCGKQFKPGK